MYYFDKYIREAKKLGRPIAQQKIIIGRNALKEGAEHLNSISKYKKIWILSDENTEAAAGKIFKKKMKNKCILEKILPAEPIPVPSLEIAEEYAAEVKNEDADLILSAGSGTLSDLGKHISFLSGIPNWCVTTAPSVDAYTSPRSAIRVKGYHESLITSPSEAIICDIDVLTAAPKILFLSGAGDLLAKYFAYLDWHLSALLTGETLEETEAEYSLASARVAIKACRSYQTTPSKSVQALTDAILTSGLVMAGIGNSRPAASVEHTVAHFWEMTGEIGNPELDRHGILVAIASRKYIDSYNAFYKILNEYEINLEKRMEAFQTEHPWRERVSPTMKPYMSKMEMEMKEKEPNPELIKKRLENYIDNRQKILSIVFPLLEELTQMGAILEDIKFPFSPASLNFPREYYEAGFTHVRYLRNRYSSVDFAADLGLEDEICPVK